MRVSDIEIWMGITAAAIALVAAYSDFRYRRIPNLVTLPAIVAGLLVHAALGGWGGAYQSLCGLAIAAGLFSLFYTVGGVGAGDVKLMAALGCLLGKTLVLNVIVLTALIGGGMSVHKMIRTRSFRRIQYRFWRLNIRREKYDPETDTIPYGVAIAVGTVVALSIQFFPGVVA